LSEAIFYAAKQQGFKEPHDRDEFCVGVSGRGTFTNDTKQHEFGSGDIMFVPAYQEHRSVDFSNDLAVWVIFYGPTEDAAY
jgi:mannose-6-phosphate isomerase-like protein (cupin superfamily)